MSGSPFESLTICFIPSLTLTISSSATVTPNGNDFKVKVYGLKSLSGFNIEEVFTSGPDMTEWSSDYASALVALTPELYESNAEA